MSNIVIILLSCQSSQFLSTHSDPLQVMCPRVSVHSPHTATISVHFIEVFISLLQVTQANSAWPCLHAVVDGGVDCECGAWEKWVDRETIGCGGDVDVSTSTVEWCTVGGFSSVCLLSTTTTSTTTSTRTTTTTQHIKWSKKQQAGTLW